MKAPKIYMPNKIPDTIQTGEKFRGRPIHDLQVDFPIFINGKEFIIPKGFQCDLGSIPRFAWWFVLPSDPNFLAAFILHDLGYGGELWPRKYMDLMFLSAMKFLGAKKFKRNLVYRAVRVGGGFTYKDHTPGSITEIRMSLGLVHYPNTKFERPLWPGGFIPGG